MIKIENTVYPSANQMDAVIRGMRNPMNSWDKIDSMGWNIGDNDLNLMKRLCKSGTDHRKFMRMINIYVDITAPLYWWSEYDTYKVGTVANSCSKMHKIHAKEFTLDDFSTDQLQSKYILQTVIRELNNNRKLFNETKDKKYWWGMIQNLPNSYNQKRTVMLNYETLHNMYHSRKNHKLDEWHVFCDWIETLPLHELIIEE